MSFSDLTSGGIDVLIHSFGQAVTYTPAVGSAESIRGIFNRKSTDVDVTGLVVKTESPNLYVKVADLPEGANFKDDEVTIAGTDYKVKERDYDGDGGVTLYLTLA